MDDFVDLAEDHDLYLVEDCAQAHGAEYEGEKVGTFGDIAAFSLYATKNIISGEGGMIVTDENELAKKVRKFRNHGQTEKYLHEELGWNERMTNIEAAIGRKQLERLETFNKKRKNNAKKLSEGINNIEGLKSPYVDSKVEHVFHQYVIKVKDDYSLSRDELEEKLNEKGIGTGVHYPKPIHQQPLYQKRGYSQDICLKPVKASNRVLSLPVHPNVDDEDISRIINILNNLS